MQTTLTHLSLAATLLAAAPALAEMKSDQYGTNNPEELSLNGALDRLKWGEASQMEMALGYGATKSGDHANARRLFEGAIAGLQSPQAMTWMSYMADNGLGAPENPEAAAEWDRRAALAGSEIGMFNYGLDLLRGRGVARDEAAGRAMIRSAAEGGDPTAQHLIDNDFDLNSVTPDADEWKYQQKLY